MFKLQTTNRPNEKDTEPKDPFTQKHNHAFNSERLSDNGTLDTFLHRIRLEMLNTDQ